jgi:transposase
MFVDTKGLRVFIYQDSIDMRCGFEKLLYFVREKMRSEINQGHLYLFFGKNRRRLKAIFYDGTGLVLIAKRIERGRFMARCELQDITEITHQELKQIFNGGLLIRPKVDRSFVTQSGQDLLHKGFAQNFFNASP